MPEKPEPRIVAKLKIERGDFIHNDLANAAFHILERVRAAQLEGQREGVGLDIMAAIAMTAFTHEAHLNFVGFTLLKEKWTEQKSVFAKRDIISKLLGIEWNDEIRPFSTIIKLQNIRNIIAHGKPRKMNEEWESVGTNNELEMEVYSVRTDWNENVNGLFLESAFEDVDRFWKMMLERANISLFETLSGGSSSITFINYAEDH
jgi:hypothetical protein